MTNSMSGENSSDLELMAQLISQSSLGAAEVQDARDQVPANVIMGLRDKIHLDAPSRRWSELPESHCVLSQLGVVMPHGDGTVEGIGFTIPNDGVVVAVNNRNDVRTFDRSDPRLPGKSERTQWTVYHAIQERRRCLLTLYGVFPWLSGDGRVRGVKLAMIWLANDPSELARRRIRDISRDLAPLIKNRLEALTVPPGSAVLQARLQAERLIEALCGDCGMIAEVVLQPTLQGGDPGATVPKEGPPHPTIPAAPSVPRSNREAVRGIVTSPRSASIQRDAQRLRALILELGQRIDPADYDVGPLPRSIRYAGPSHFQELVRLFHPALVEALRVLGLDPEEARELAMLTFVRVIQEVRHPGVGLDEFVDALAHCAAKLLGSSGHPALPAQASGPRDPRVTNDMSHALYQRVIDLYEKGLRPSEVADALGISAGDVESVVRDEMWHLRESRYEYLGTFAPD